METTLITSLNSGRCWRTFFKNNNRQEKETLQINDLWTIILHMAAF